MKRCSRCGNQREEEDFPVRSNRPSRQPWCRECKNAYDRVWYRQNREKHIESVKEVNRRRVRRNRVVVTAAKDASCVDCGVRYPPHVMDFDHGDSEKLGAISEGLYTWSTRRLRAEIAKCEVVCANCHRERTYGLSDGDPELHPSYNLTESVAGLECP